MPLESATYISQLVNTNPPGPDDADTADDHLRLIKDVLLNTLGQLSGAVLATHIEINRICDGITATAAQVNALQAAFGGKTLTSTDDKVDNFPAGTIMTFQQTAAPTGWTKITTHNDKAFRVVSGTVGSGGTIAFSTAFASTKYVDGTAITTNQMPSHVHLMASRSHNGDACYVPATPTTANPGVGSPCADMTTKSAGSGATHNHSFNMNVQYVDLILASKN